VGHQISFKGQFSPPILTSQSGMAEPSWLQYCSIRGLTGR
jgi:hypothetical protein